MDLLVIVPRTIKDLWKFGQGTKGCPYSQSIIAAKKYGTILFHLFSTFISGIHVAKNLAKYISGQWSQNWLHHKILRKNTGTCGA
jgi:hypothetical protein